MNIRYETASIDPDHEIVLRGEFLRMTVVHPGTREKSGLVMLHAPNGWLIKGPSFTFAAVKSMAEGKSLADFISELGRLQHTINECNGYSADHLLV